MKLLTRREHTCQELRQKLQHKGFSPELAEQVTEDLRQEGLVSDERFAESYLRSRIDKGYGPVRIQYELRQRGASDDIIAATVIEDDPDWLERARRVREKRFGHKLPKDIKDKLKQQRFLQYRGFTQQQLKYAVAEHAELMD
jgi:regulatory protein